MERYRHLNTYLKEKFGERTLKIPVDGGFTCPNRDGKVGYGGCVYCTERGSGEHLKLKPIPEQIKDHLESYRGKRANKFIVYFQNFTNTYDSIENLKEKYDSALIDDRIVGIDIATRPDCINEDICKLLQSYTNNSITNENCIDKKIKSYSVTVELGLQTSNDEIAKIINRGYPLEIFTKAVNLLNKYKIDVLDEYLNKLLYVITHLRKHIIIHRISGDAPKDLLVAPTWNSHKKWVLNGLDKIMKEQDRFQGDRYKKI